MRSHCLRVLGLAVLLLLPGGAEAERGPSTPKERTKALRLIRQLEADPLGEKAYEARRWLALWLLDVPDLQVRYCAEVVGGGLPPSPVLATGVPVQSVNENGQAVTKSVTVVIGAVQKGSDGAIGASVAISPQRVRPTILSKRKRTYSYTNGD